MTKPHMNVYFRPDGVEGCGHVIEWGGLQQHSVSWPDGPAQRYRDEDLEDRQITFQNVHSVVFDAMDDLSKIIPGVQVEQVTTLADQPPAEASSPGGIAPIPEPGEPASIAPFDATATEAANIRIALQVDPEATNRQVIDRLHAVGISVSASQVSRERKALAKLAEADTAAASEAVDGEVTEQSA